jgi:hypothetical protein
VNPKTRTNFGYQFGLIGFVTLSSFLRNSAYAISIHPRYIPRALLVLTTSALTAPLRLWERLRHGRRIAAVRVEAPIFVIGHWRSGTTHLHNLMSQDPTFGYLTMYQAMVPDCSLVGERWLKPLLSRIVPAKRPMDNVQWPIDAPQEEEIPLAKLTPYSLYVRFLFPRKAADLFRKYVLLEDAPPRVAREVKRRYYRLLQVASLHAGGRRLILKNPVNTARVRLLLELFPDAKFIHIYRSPYDVFASTAHMHQQMLQITTLQTLPPRGTGDAILALYASMMHRYFEDRGRIPAGHLAEVCYEDLERDPMREMQRIYETLELDTFARARPAIEAYVRSQRTYRKNDLHVSADDRARIDARWAFAFAELRYRMEAAV